MARGRPAGVPARERRCHGTDARADPRGCCARERRCHGTRRDATHGTGGSTRVSSVENFTICRSCRSPFPVNRQVEHDNVDTLPRARPYSRCASSRRTRRSNPWDCDRALDRDRPLRLELVPTPRLSGLASRAESARSVAPRFVSKTRRRGRRSRRRRRRGRDVSRDAASDGRRETETDRERLSGVLRASERKQSR